MSDSIASLVAQFNVPGEFHAARRNDRGHINDTYCVEMRSGEESQYFLLQRINHHVFADPPALMGNITRVTAHLRQKLGDLGCKDVSRRVLEVIPTGQGAAYHHHAETGFWRMYAFVAGARAVEDQATPAEVYEAGRGFGGFLAQLTDLPGPALAETIPNFHHGPLRFRAFRQAVWRDPIGRAARAREEIEQVSRHEWLLAEPQRLTDQGALPLRAAHNDTKSSNVLLDDRTGEALCVIDLDTVMPGLALYDFGDLVRTTVTGAAEDVRDARNVQVRSSHLEAAARGFLDGARGLLDPHEIDSLRLGPPYMALIMATRFLTDYLLGDVYYKVSRPQQNLDRCRAQLALLYALLAHEDELARLLRGP